MHWLQKSRDVVLGVFGIVSVALAIYLAFDDKVAAASVLFSAGMLLSLLSSVRMFESIKGLGIEAKMRNLDNKIHEADVLLERIRDSSTLMARISFQVMSKIGRWNGVLDKKETLAISDQLVAQLKGCGVAENVIADCAQPWYEVNLRDLAVPVLNGLRHLAQLKTQEFNEEMRSLPRASTGSDPEWIRLSDSITRVGQWSSQLSEMWEKNFVDVVTQAERLIESFPLVTPEEKRDTASRIGDKLDRARYYLAHKEFRSREEWMSTNYGE